MIHDLVYNPHRRHLLLTLLVGAGLVAYLSGSIERVYGFDLALLLALAGGFPIYFGAVSSLVRRQISADLAVGLAAFAAMWIGQYAVAAEVILIMLIGEVLENFAVGRTRSGIASLLALRPDEARVRRDGEERIVPLDEIRSDDAVLLRPGDRIPVDGKVVGGSSSVDQSPITGESLPADKTAGEEVFAGTINLYGALEVAVERLGRDTTLEQIIHLVEEAEAAKAPVQRLADRYAGYFVPIVLLAAGGVYWLTGEVVRSVAVLVVACPCALVLATPTAIAAGIGSLVRRGVLIKGGNVLEQIGRLRSVVFDKTGTLTLARYRVSQIVPAPGRDEADVLRLAASVERNSEHAVGRLIVAEAAERQIEPAEATEFAAHPGLGAQAVVGDATVRVGNPRFLEQADVVVSESLRTRADELGEAGCTVVLVADGTEAVGAVAVQDTVRPEAGEAVDRLRSLGIGRIAMLTGDNEAAARSVADGLGVADARSGLLPNDKVEAVRGMQQGAGPVAMVGDGINDAPSLVAADVGVAMAHIGTDVAIASADVVLVGDDLRRLADAIACGRHALRIVWQNILGFALVFNVLAVAVASLGWISPVVAAVLHQVSSLTVVINSMRLLIDPVRWRSRWERVRQASRQRWRTAAATGVAAVVVGYVLSGLHVVSVGEVAVVQHFGKRAGAPEPPGLHYRLPFPFGRHWRVRPDEVRRVEVGFRTVPGPSTEPPAYEWNVQHRGGRTQRQAREANVLAGDENLLDVNLVVQYRVADPVAALFKIGASLTDGASKWDVLVRHVAEAALRAEMSQRPIEQALGSARADLENAVHERITTALRQCGAGFSVDRVCLADVHPPVEVVPAFRDVASAREEKEARINEAVAYQYETDAMARGQASEKTLAADGFRHDRTQRARGGAERFVAIANASRLAPSLTRLRLYLQTVEELLEGRRKIILDRAPDGGRRRLFLGTKGLWNVAPAEMPEAPREGGGAEETPQP